jgi:hypothetical protein
MDTEKKDLTCSETETRKVSRRNFIKVGSTVAVVFAIWMASSRSRDIRKPNRDTI